MKTDFTEVRLAIDDSRNIKPSTLNAYITTLNKIWMGTTDEENPPKNDPLRFLENTEKIFEYMEEYKRASVRNEFSTETGTGTGTNTRKFC